MRRWIRRLSVAAASAAVAAPLVAISPAQAGVALPGGRPGFVVSVIGGKANAVAVRLAMYQFSTSGTVVERYWTWRQNSITGKDQYRWTKPSSGYSTAGCLRACPIRAPFGFQSGGNGYRASGRFSVSRDVLTIRWSWGSSERWRLNTSKPGVVGATLITSNPQSHGWGLGSNAGLSRAVDARTLYNSGYLSGPWAENVYGRPTRSSRVGFNPPDHSLCRSGLCIQGNRVTSPDKRSWYSSYYATNPARDGRKVFHNFQLGVVQQMESPGSSCISRGGGHTEAMLQALDDNGNLVGLVGVEASLSQQRPGQAVVTAFAMAKWSLQSSGSPLLS